jgi:hypothetical protein
MTRKPPTETSAEDANSRRGRLVARRSHRTRVAIVVVVILIAGGIAAAAYALKNNDPQTRAAGTNETPTTFGKRGTLVAPNPVKATAPRTLDHQHPLKLWVGGDSLAGSFGPALGDQVGATGVVSTVIDYKVSSGLSSNDIRNWYDRATEQMTSDNPDAVVFIIGANDAPIVNNVDNNGDNIPDWQAEYRLKVARMMDLLVGPHHRTVFWLGPPTLGDPNMDAGAKAIGPVMREEALKRAPDVVYLDTYSLFSKDGTYSRYILDENGNQITARISDGTHFSQDGAAYLARAVFSLIDGRWKLTKQADPKNPIGWTSAPGSGELVPGYSQQPQSKYQNGNSGSNNTTPNTTTGAADPTTVVTSAPTTVAPTTTPRTTPVTTTPKATTPTPTTTHPGITTSPPP